jgi:hypothetical protein
MAEHGFGDDFRRNFVTGVAALFPIIITLLLFTWLYRYVDRTIGAATTAAFCQALAFDVTVFTGFYLDAPPQEVATVAGRRAYAAERFPRVVGSLAGLLASARPDTPLAPVAAPEGAGGAPPSAGQALGRAVKPGG